MDTIRLSGRSQRPYLRNSLPQNASKKLCTLLFVLLFPLIQSDAQRSYPPGYINDNSDWWSSVLDAQTMGIKVQHRMPAPSSFQILGITLGDGGFNDFHNIIAKLGQANITSRSDGAEAREQVCYISSGSAEKVHLIFEHSETIYSFYLFSGGNEWTGSDRCVSSHLISGSLGTASGMHLGQSRKEIETMLGQPSATYDNRLLYSFEGESTKEGLVWTIDVRVDARFENSKLTYLAISRSEVN
jgi:hypothetical protein